MTISTTPTTWSAFVLVQIEVDGVPTNLTVQDARNFEPGEINSYPVAISGVLSLPAGAVVGLRLTFTGGGSSFFYKHATFSGVVM
jgi:hypothetical protein